MAQDKEVDKMQRAGMEPVVSVIIPTYKRSGRFLKRAIDSVLAQSYRHLELVIVDDNDPESPYRKETEQFMESYCEEKRIVYVRNPRNLGGGPARNTGIAQASGAYITFLDDDDRYLPDKVKRQLQFMLEHDYDLTFTNLKIVNEDDKLIDYREFKFIRDFSNEALLRAHLTRHITGTSTFMYKREALQRIGGFQNIRMGQEFLLMLHSIEGNLKIGYLPYADVLQSVHRGERISNGANKLDGERYMIRFKRTYFPWLSGRERMFVRFRHHVVMAVTALRSRMYATCAQHACLAVVHSPLDAIIEPLRLWRKIQQFKSRTNSLSGETSRSAEA